MHWENIGGLSLNAPPSVITQIQKVWLGGNGAEAPLAPRSSAQGAEGCGEGLCLLPGFFFSIFELIRRVLVHYIWLIKPTCDRPCVSIFWSCSSRLRRGERSSPSLPWIRPCNYVHDNPQPIRNPLSYPHLRSFGSVLRCFVRYWGRSDRLMPLVVVWTTTNDCYSVRH